jgi:multidrug transporter EmrE-like cation transporter
MNIYLLLLLSGAFVIMGDFFAKLWSVERGSWLFILSMVGYTLSSLLYIPVLLKGDLVITALIWSLLNIVGFSIIGLYVFKERLDTLQWIGVILGMVAMVLLTWRGWK